MPSMNGISATPASPKQDTSSPANASNKRKRRDSPSPPRENGTSVPPPTHAQPRKSVQDSIRNVWEILKTHGEFRPIFEQLASHPVNSQENTEHSSKRTKTSSSSEPRTIAQKVETGGYLLLAEFASDLDTVHAQLQEASASKGFELNEILAYRSARSQNNSETLEHSRLLASFTALKKYAIGLLQRESARLKCSDPESPPDRTSTSKDTVVDGIKQEEDTTNAKHEADAGRAVLTLFGDAQGHKQLFSSLQQPLTSQKLTKPHDGGHHVVDGYAPLREGGLPNGITSAKVLPALKDEKAQTNVQRPTLKDLFSPPSSVQSLIPPKTPKPGSARDSTISWSQPVSTEQSSKQGSYRNEKLTTGNWLGYGGVAPAEEPSSPQAKRKQRDRALSTGEGALGSSNGIKAAQLQAKEDALYHRAYSSFAPVCDNSSAIVSQETKTQLWWQRWGSAQFDQLFYAEQQDEDVQTDHITLDEPMSAEDESEMFKKAVEDFEPASLTKPGSQSESEDREADDMLEEISGMLETLHSFQRIRMSSHAANKASPFQSSTLQDFTGSPSTPSVAEMETYKTLKAQLAVIVSMLPPYALSKLNGDQLEDLNISRQMPIETRNYRGVMEEDRASRDAKQAAFHAAVGAAQRQNVAMTPSQHYSQSRNPPLTQQRTSFSSPQYFNTAQTVPRPATNFSRQPLSSWQTPSHSYMPQQRPAYASPQAFSQQPPRQMNGNLRPSLSTIQSRSSTGNYPQTQTGYQRPQNYAPATYNPYGLSGTPARPLQRNYTPQPQNLQSQHQLTSRTQMPQSSFLQMQNQQSAPQQSHQAFAPQDSNSPAPAPMVNGTSTAGSRPHTPATPATPAANQNQGAPVASMTPARPPSRPPSQQSHLYSQSQSQPQPPGNSTPQAKSTSPNVQQQGTSTQPQPVAST